MMTLFGGGDNDDDDHNGDETEAAYIFISKLKTQVTTKHNKQEAQEL